MLKLVINLGDTVPEHGYVLVGFVAVELREPARLYFKQLQYVVTRHLAVKRRFPRLKATVDVSYCLVEVAAIFKFLVFVHPLLYENLFERRKVYRLKRLSTLYFKLSTQHILGVIDVVAQYITHRQEFRFLVLYYAAIWRNACLAIGKRVQGIDGLVARRTRLQCDYDFGGR